MPESNEDYRNLLNEKFLGLHNSMDLKFDNIDIQLKNIILQTTKTNGKVLKLEESVGSLKEQEIRHLAKCPHSSRFDRIEAALEDYKVKNEENLKEYSIIKRFPKISIGVLAFSIFILLSQYSNYSKNNSTETIVKHNQEVTETILKNQEYIKTLEIKIEDLNKVINKK